MNLTNTAINDPGPGPLVVKSVDLSEHQNEMLSAAVDTLNDEVFEGCPGLVLTTDEDAPGDILVIDDPSDASAKLRGCGHAFVAVTKSREYAVINMCEKRMGINWPHAVHPDLYMFAHQLGKALGLPNSTAHPLGWASYSANDASVRSPQVDPRTQQPKTLLFRWGDKEREVLRSRYCK